MYIETEENTTKKTSTTRSALRPAATKQRLVRKAVSFQGETAYEAEDHHHFDDSRKETMWYTKQEINGQREQMRKILQGMLDVNKDCYRGLEVFAHGNRAKRYESNVLPVLEMHYKNVDAFNRLRVFAAKLNKEIAQEAVQRGAQDATEAYEIYLSCRYTNSKEVKKAFTRNATYKTSHVSSSRSKPKRSSKLARSA
jgi:hypothetical protein